MNPDLTDHHPEARAVIMSGVRWPGKEFISITNVLTVNDGNIPEQSFHLCQRVSQSDAVMNIKIR